MKMGESKENAPQISLKDQGNDFFKAGNYLKAAALYTQAIKQDPSNHTLYRYVQIILFNFVPFIVVSINSLFLITCDCEFYRCCPFFVQSEYFVQ